MPASMLDKGMFNYQSRQIFVVQPRNTGGGIVSFMLSLDSRSANTKFKASTLDLKMGDWNNFIAKKPPTAHVNGFINFGHDRYLANLADADGCERYVHKHHFYELDYVNSAKKHSLLDLMLDKQAVGIYLTEQCIDRLYKIRPQTKIVDFYQTWVYSNQTKLLKDFYNIDCRHTWSFSEMLDNKTFMDQLMYCQEIFDLDTDPDLYVKVIKDWHEMLSI